VKLITVTASTEEVVTLADARAQLSLLDDTSHDARILRLIRAATRQAEAHTGMRCLTQTVRLELDAFPEDTLDLGVYPVASITSVAYDDENGVAQTLTANTHFYADLGGLTPRLLPVEDWPATKAGKPGAVRITMVVGYTSADLVPDDFSQAVLLRVAELFDNTAETSTMNLSPVSVGFEMLLAPHRRITF
jgi:uncharacterized phiE125 gp8 family phage protein